MVAKRKRGADIPAIKTKAAKTADGLFEQYKDSLDPTTIGPEGIERLCTDLKISPADKKVLILAYIMKAEKMGYFSKSEFARGLSMLGVSTLAQLKKALPTLDQIITHRFSDFYDFAFRFCLTEPGQKIIDVETAVEMLKVVHPDGRFTDPFCEYLASQTDYKKINLDQWSSFLKFSNEVKSDLSNADDNPAWPVLLDNFSTWYLQKMSE